MSFVVRYSASARDDLARLYDFLLDRATTAEDLDLAEQALAQKLATRRLANGVLPELDACFAALHLETVAAPLSAV